MDGMEREAFLNQAADSGLFPHLCKPEDLAGHIEICVLEKSAAEATHWKHICGRMV